MPSNPAIGAGADAIKIAWYQFEKHAIHFEEGILQCEQCFRVLLQLRTDPELHDRPFGQHRARHDACCEDGQRLLKPWIKAVNAQVKRFTGPRLTVSGPAVE